MIRKFHNKNDFIVFAALMCAALIWAGIMFIKEQTSTNTAEIIYHGKTVKTVNLSKNEIFTLEENPNISFEVRNGAIAFISSDCPDKICVNTGFIRNSFEQAVCLPNFTELRISATKKANSDIDIIVK